MSVSTTEQQIKRNLVIVNVYHFIDEKEALQKQIEMEITLEFDHEPQLTLEDPKWLTKLYYDQIETMEKHHNIKITMPDMLRAFTKRDNNVVTLTIQAALTREHVKEIEEKLLHLRSRKESVMECINDD